MGTYVKTLQSTLNKFESDRINQMEEYDKKISILEDSIKKLKIEASTKTQLEKELKELKTQYTFNNSLLDEFSGSYSTTGLFSNSSQSADELLKSLSLDYSSLYKALETSSLLKPSKNSTILKISSSNPILPQIDRKADLGLKLKKNETLTDTSKPHKTKNKDENE